MRSFKPVFSRMVLALFWLVGLAGMPLSAQAQSSVTLTLHDVRVQPLSGTQAYDVAVYLSLLDSAGNPIKDAAAENFSVDEDNQPVQVASLASAENEPINVALMLDTSSSMTGEKIEAARMAASRFISNLVGGDQVAVLTFDLTSTNRIDFTTDHTAARQQVEMIQPTPGAGTCLYDAAYETIQQVANLSSTGRRAVILLTDGRDEAGGQPCSAYTPNDVIGLASDEETRIPVYTIGLGSEVDAQALENLSYSTGGRYLASPGTTQLEALFGRLSDELRSQYVLHYTSTAAPGEHTLTLKVDYRDIQEQASQRIDLPALPYNIAFTTPQDGSSLGEPTTISITISGQGAPIQQVVFLANSVSIGLDAISPFELEWDPSGLEAGPVFLEAIAQDAGGAELARSGVTITYQAEIIPTPTPGDQPDGKLPATTLLLIGVSLAVLLGLVITVIAIASKRRKQEKLRDLRWKETVQGDGAQLSSLGSIGRMEDRTLDSFIPSEGALGVLVIQQSDDPALNGQRFEISKSVTTLGRKASNDIMFPKDSPVSRQHAVIEERSGMLYLSEVSAADESGQAKRPAFGTFVNDQQIEAPVMLRDGDEIRLGKRVRIHFVSSTPAPGDTERTMDQGSDSEKTMDG
jgi:Ca-activated chloride channel family protein